MAGGAHAIIPTVPFAVIVMTGRGHVEHEGSYGPFPSEESAEDWCRREGIAIEPPVGNGDRWGVIRPLRSPT